MLGKQAWKRPISYLLYHTCLPAVSMTRVIKHMGPLIAFVVDSQRVESEFDGKGAE